MKFKLLILSLIASNAIYANNLKIISHEVSHITWAEYKKINKLSTKFATCEASAEPAAASSKNPEPIVVVGNVEYTIVNQTKDYQIYWVDEYMCVNDYGCTHIRDSVSLEAQLTGFGGGTIYNTESLEKGSYIDEATIQVTGESTCFVQDKSTVTIS